MRAVYVISAAALFGCCCWEYWRVAQWLRAASLTIGEVPVGSVRPAGSAGSVEKSLDIATDRH